MSNSIDKEITRLQNLKQNKNKDRSIIEKIARHNIWTKQINISSRFERSAEKQLAEEYFDNYLQNYEIKDFNDVQNVADLVYEEILKHRIQKEIDKIANKENTTYVPDKAIQSMHSIEERIWSLKEKIGIVGTKEQDDLSSLQELEKEFSLYIPFNRNEFTFYAPVKCKQCGTKDIEPVLLRRRVKDFEALKHPFFSGRFWYNRRGIELVKSGIWSKEQYAFVFFTSVAYIDWCLENEHKIVEIDDIEENTIIEFINKCPHLKKEKIPEQILKNNNKEVS